MQQLPAKDAVALGSTRKKTRAVLKQMWHFFLLRDFGYKADDAFQVYKKEYACKDLPTTIQALCDKALDGDINAVRCLLRAGVNPGGYENSAIKMAAREGRLEVVRLLLSDKRVDPSTRTNFAIKMAAENGHLEVVKLLLQDPRVDPSDGGDYAIRRAATNGHLELVELLLKDKRVDPSAQDNYAIGVAAYNGHLGVVEMLLADKRVSDALPLDELARYKELVKN